MSYTYRCGRAACRRQVTYPKPITQYVREKHCECGGTLHPFGRDKIRDKQRSCHCGEIPWGGPHRRGTRAEIDGRMFYCKHYKGDPECEEMNRELGVAGSIKGAVEPPF